MAVATRSRRTVILFDDFSGGLNMRDAATQLARNEFAQGSWNITLDERGGGASRLGITKLNGASALPAVPCYLYESKNADAVLAYIHSLGDLYKSTDGMVTWSSVYTAFTAGARGWIVDFKDRVVVGNTSDGIFSFPSTLAAPTHTTGGTNDMEVPLSSCGGSWQGRVICAGNPTAGARARVYACKPADELTWDTGAGAWTNDLNEIDSNVIVALGSGQGVDFSNDPSLLVAKKNSVYRVDDSSTGAYVTLHSSGAGAASAVALASNLGAICMVNDIGIWMTDGLSVPVRVSDNLEPLFTPAGLNLTQAQMDGWSAFPVRDRIYFNLTRAGSSTNDLTIEYHPPLHSESAWLAAHQGMALGPGVVYTKGTRKTAAAHVSSGYVYEVAKGGTDDGAAIDCSLRTRVIPLAGGSKARLHQARVWGRGAFNAFIIPEFSQAQGEEMERFDFDALAGGAWDEHAWDDDDFSWEEASYEADDDRPLDQTCRYVSLAIEESASSVAEAPPLLGDGAQPEVGAFAIYAVRFDFSQLEAS